MQNIVKHKTELDTNGYSIIDSIYSKQEVISIIQLINQLDTSKPIFRKTENIFAIRQFLKEVQEIKPLIFNENLLNVIKK
jgi:hypothetical protein